MVRISVYTILIATHYSLVISTHFFLEKQKKVLTFLEKLTKITPKFRYEGVHHEFSTFSQSHPA